ncbi:GGDEF and EAL domain proteins [hydrothermal vent metagenome]|uniref:GGDEF and EAL domain proteins n=1 Tax=hydrothermal vent metagenome TaxID=652676 RepID=A0A1W1D3Y4_9ZZZZ
MTLFKQMALVVSFIIVLVLATVMIINYNNAKKDMIQSLYQTTVNNIATLTDKLAQTDGEEAEIQSVVDAAFDSGYYKMILFQSDTINYKQIDDSLPEGVPEWFIKFTNIKLKPISADVTSGWSIIGKVSVIGDSGVVYKGLYKIFQQLFYLFIVSVSGSLILINIILHFVLKPLKKVQEQAEAILKNEFIIQKELPFTTEFKDVVNGMNAMVLKVEDIFNKGNEAIQKNRELLYKDPVTKLFNRRYLMLKLLDLIQQNNSISGGSSLFVSLNSIEELTKHLGHQKTNDFLLQFAQELNNVTKKFQEKLIARVNATDFTLILPECDSDVANDIAKKINKKWEELSKNNNINQEYSFINIGIYRYKPTDTIASLMTNTDNALAKAIAKENGNTYFFEAKDNKSAMGKEEWRELLEDAIKHNRFHLIFRKTINFQSKQIQHKVLSFTMQDKNKKEYLYGDFIAPAINLNMVSEIYISILQDLFTNPHKDTKESLISINLSSEFIKDPNAFEQLSMLLQKYHKTIPFQLCFEISDTFTIKNLALVKNFTKLFSKYNFQFGLNSFTGESQDFHYLKELHPIFLKSDTSYLLDQSDNLMNALQVVTDSLGIVIIASFVKEKEELQKLEEKHITTIQGPIVDQLL